MFGVEFVLTAVDKTASGVNKATGRLRDAQGRFVAGGGGLDSMGGRADRLAAKLDAAGRGFDKMGAMGRRAVEGPLSVAASLEEQLSVVQGKSGATAEQLERIKNKARELGANTKHSALAAASGFEVLSAAGIGVEDQLVAIDPVLTLATAGFTDIDKAAKLNTDTLGAWGLGVEHAGEATDLLIGAANKSKQSIATLSASLKDAGPVAHAAGASIGDVLALQGILAKGGITGGKAGTDTRNMFSRLQAPGKKAQAMLKRLRVETKDADGNLRKMSAIMADLSGGLDSKFGAGKGGAKRQKILKEIFGERSTAAAMQIMAASVDGSLAKMQGDIETFDAKAAAALAGANTKGAMAQAKSAYEELQIVAGDELLPVASELLDVFTSMARVTGTWAKKNTGLVKTLMLMASALAAVGMIMGPVMRGAAAIVKLAKYARLAFAALKGAVLALSTAFRTMAASLLANPITWVVIGVVALIAAGVLLWKNWDRVGEFFRRLWERMPGPVQSALRLISAPIRLLVAGAKWLAANWRKAWDWIVDTVRGAGAFLSSKFEEITGAPADIMALWTPVGEFFTDLWDGIVSAFDRAIGYISDKIGGIGTEIENLERSLPAWVTGREEVLAGGALDRARAIQASAANGGGYTPESLGAAAGGLASTFGGSLRIVLASESGGAPTVASSESSTSGNAGITLDTGFQGVG